MLISDYRRDFSQYCTAFETAHFRYRAGFDKELHLEEIYDRCGDLFTAQAIESLRIAYEETPPQFETERLGVRLLTGSARAGFLEARARGLTAEVARYEAAAVVEWDGERFPLNDVPRIISNEPLASRRRDLGARLVDARSRCNDSRIARLESLHESARALDFDSYLALFSEITGTDFTSLAASAARFLESTESAYSSTLARTVARDLPDVAFDELQLVDFLYFQRILPLDPFFPSHDLMLTYATAMAGFGIRIERQPNIHIDAESRASKNPRAACFRIEPPDDVRLLIAPVGGVHDYTTLFHEAGHAQHYGWSSRELCRRYPEFVYATDHATSEGYAFLFSHLFQDVGWLMEHRKVATSAEAREIVRRLALLSWCSIRRRCASLEYEIELHEDGPIQAEELAVAHSDAVSRATRFKRSPALFLTEVDDGFYSAAYLRAWGFEVALREHLRTRYGRRWWASRKAGDELIDLWNTSSRYTVEELASLMGFGEISFDLLAESLIAATKED